jgi:hypothetical protein
MRVAVRYDKKSFKFLQQLCSMSQFANLWFISRRILLGLAVSGVTSAAFAQKQAFSSAEAALAAIFPNKKTWVWTQDEGDLNGDGLKDLAILLVVDVESEKRQNRLIVLSGEAGGKYSVLSVSSEYCPAQKFYNLLIKGSSLHVEEVHRVDADNMVTNAIQFRFNKKLADFELIGRENQWEVDQDNSGRGLSVNYITGTAKNYERVKGRIKSQKTSRFPALPLAQLNGFDCEKHLPREP